MNFTIKQIRAFLAVADTESFSLAARRLHVTPGAISLMIKEMEEGIGFSLFDRNTRRVTLSGVGADFRPAAEKVLIELQAMSMTASDLRSKAVGAVRIAAPAFLACALLPPAMAAFRVLKPRVRMRLIDCVIEDLVSLVANNQVDLAVGPDRPVGDSVRRMGLYDSPWVLWCKPDHALAQSERLTWQSILQHEVVVVGRDYETRMAGVMEKLPAHLSFVPAEVVSNTSTALSLASSGVAVALCPAFVRGQANAFGLVMRSIEAPEITRQLSIYVSNDRALSPAASGFVDYLQSHLAELEQHGTLAENGLYRSLPVGFEKNSILI